MEDELKQNIQIPYLTQREYDLIQWSLGNLMREADKKQLSLERMGFMRTDIVSVLRKMGVAVDLSPDAMREHRDTTKLQSVLTQVCMRCMHNRMAHAISSKSKKLDPTLSNLSTFLEETENPCLMPTCSCRSFRG